MGRSINSFSSWVGSPHTIGGRNSPPEEKLFGAVLSQAVHDVFSNPIPESPVAICFGGTHYPSKFTDELLEGTYSLGTVIPKHALDDIDEELFSHIIKQNNLAKFALLDWRGLGSNKQKVLDFLESTSLEIIKL